MQTSVKQQALSLALVISSLFYGQGAFAENWYGCTHAEWKETFSYTHILVSESFKNERGQGQGVTCKLLTDSASSAESKACSIDKSSSNQT